MKEDDLVKSAIRIFDELDIDWRRERDRFPEWGFNKVV